MNKLNGGISKKTVNTTLGFTLMELMVAMLIAAIVLAIALPSYQAHIRKNHRTVLQGDLLLFAQAMEKSAHIRFTFEGQAQNGNTGAPSVALFPALAPLQGHNKFYALTIASASNNSYLLKATPISNGFMAGDGRLTIDNKGIRCWYKGEDTSGGTCSPW